MDIWDTDCWHIDSNDLFGRHLPDCDHTEDCDCGADVPWIASFTGESTPEARAAIAAVPGLVSTLHSIRVEIALWAGEENHPSAASSPNELVARIAVLAQKAVALFDPKVGTERVGS